MKSSAAVGRKVNEKALHCRICSVTAVCNFTVFIVFANSMKHLCIWRGTVLVKESSLNKSSEMCLAGGQVIHLFR